jgi:hypothetical protein
MTTKTMRSVAVRLLLSVVGVAVAHGSATAQYGSSCPNGQCPAVRFAPVGTAHIPTLPRVGRVQQPTIEERIPATNLPLSAGYTPAPVTTFPAASSPVVQTAGWHTVQSSPVSAVPVTTTTTVSTPAPVQSWAGREAVVQANAGRMAHFTAPPAGHYAGVGMSTRSPQDALNRCCFTGQRTCVDQSVRGVRTADGRVIWYAAKLFR